MLQNLRSVYTISNVQAPCSLQSDLRSELRPEETIATTHLYFNRYLRYIQTSGSSDPLDPPTLALAALSLSTKSTESPRRLHTLLEPAYALLLHHPQRPKADSSSRPPSPPSRTELSIPSRTYDALRATLIRAELLLLRALGFELRLHPLALEFLPRYLERAIEGGGASQKVLSGVRNTAEELDRMRGDARAASGVVDVMETGVGRDARASIVASYKRYRVANLFTPRTIAAACIYLTMEMRGLRVISDNGNDDEALSNWVENVSGGKVDREDFEDILAELRRPDPVS
ncbi:MAG: hypothetical protein M1825_001126 [Sarcosagium campestre]|nr:MAG: hypothetical protein M1825_001126 [Sarcosagium campestre]